MKLTKLIPLSILFAASVAATSVSATIVTLNPSANNGGAGTLSAAYGPFQTDKGTTNFASLLNIGATTGATSFTETGFLDINEWSITPNTTSGLKQPNGYFVYATFTISGTGSWIGNTFVADNNSVTVTANVFGSPGNNQVQYSNPSAGNLFGVTPGASDFLLGTASLNLALSANATISGNTTPPNNLATEAFDAILNFTPAAGTSGPGGFWQSPFPFNVTLNTSATGNAGTPGTTYTVSGGHVLILTSVTAGPNPIGAGSGNVIFQTAAVPEPSTIALLGIALLVIGGIVRKSGGRA